MIKKIADPRVSELFVAYSAGGFSASGHSTPELCMACAKDDCDEILRGVRDCLCCDNGHVV